MTLEKRLISFLIPRAILVASFEVQNIDDSDSLLVIELLEKQECISSFDSDLVLVSNGYMNPIELQHFHMNGKKCRWMLIRRRWKEKNNPSNSYHNSYFFAQKGTKVTPDFWDFLKETGL
jgi:hypothetical protein